MGSFDHLLQEFSLRETFHAAESSSVASDHRRNSFSARAEIFDRVDFVVVSIFFGWKGAFGSVDVVEILEESGHPFVDGVFLLLG